MACEYETWEERLQDPTATPVSLPLEFLKTITHDFSSEQELGSGGSGVVYKGVLPSGKLIAVKKLLDLHNMGDEKFRKEVSSLMGIKHRNVVQFVGYCAESSFEAIDLQGNGNYILAEIPKRLLCFEHVCNKSLDKYISDESSGLEWSVRYEIIRGICAGLHYLHEECHIVHLDLKPENILMDATMVPKIADFGLSRIFGDKQSRIITQNFLGIRGYMAPEYIIQGIVSIKADMYSFGVLIIEILTGCRYYPLSKENNPQGSDTSFQHFKEKISCDQEEGHWGDHAKLTNICRETGEENIKSEIKIPFNSIPEEANKHDVLESMLCDESVEPTFLELSLLQEITSNFSDDHEIGRSRSGVIYKGNLSNGSTVIVKRISISIAIGDQLFLCAVKSLMGVKHNNIVRFLGYCANAEGKVAMEGGESVIVMVRERLLCFEYLSNGNLKSLLTDESRGFDWRTRYQAIIGICQGLCYLHDGFISHLDLKLDNILFDDKMVPKILEYGFSRVFSEAIRRTVLKNIHGSLAYMTTPEYLAGGQITLKSDIYCLGYLIMQIVTGQSKTNYSDTELASITESWRSRLEPEASKGHTFETCSQQVKICIEIGINCMDHDPGNRPTTRCIVRRLDNKREMEQSFGSDVSNSSPKKISSLSKRMQISPLSKLSSLSKLMQISPVSKMIVCKQMIFPALRAPRALHSAGVKIVLKVALNCKNGKSCIMHVVSKIDGIRSLAYDSGNNTLTVQGCVDVMVIVAVLRKRKHGVHVITVGDAKMEEETRTHSTRYCPACLSSYIAAADGQEASCTIM
ncbi:uncharacterized protein [Lolium perenne]|uniref:uncharacterized protein isoform X2 n=1 Tax=Lolium perenne TaxID=4522 RepID=UPI0021F5DC0A|nr:uncharacterized protein LOC127305229 isoform X2 [Lolium perenne]